MAKPSQTVAEVARMMCTHVCGIIPVGTPNKVLGVVTDHDIALRVIARGNDPTLVSAEQVMRNNYISCSASDTLTQAADLMRKNDVSRVLVLDGNIFLGMVTIADLVRNLGDRREGDKVIHTLLGRKFDAKDLLNTPMATVVAGSGVYETA